LATAEFMSSFSIVKGLLNSINTGYSPIQLQGTVHKRTLHIMAELALLTITE